MKTGQETLQINNFCNGLSAALSMAGVPAYLQYDNRTEHVDGFVDEKCVKINVHMSSVAASARDIIRGLQGVLT